MKSCRICLQEKENSYFVKHKGFKSGYDTICLDCSRAKVKQWRLDFPEKKKALDLKESSKSDYVHNKHLKAVYKINKEIYNQMFEKQQGCCKICLTLQSNFKNVCL